MRACTWCARRHNKQSIGTSHVVAYSCSYIPVVARHIGLRIGLRRPFATVAEVKLLIRACRFNATLLDSDGVPFAALAKREGVSPSYFTRLVPLSYLASDIRQAILDGRQPRGLNADKLLAHSRLPLGWHEQRTVLGVALSN
jgi:hypothetical protein